MLPSVARLVLADTGARRPLKVRHAGTVLAEAGPDDAFRVRRAGAGEVFGELAAVDAAVCVGILESGPPRLEHHELGSADT